MAVLIEGFAVVIRRDRIHKKMEGGWARFVRLAPNSTLCADDELASAGFLHEHEASDFIAQLETHGLTHIGARRKPIDLIQVHQSDGPLVDCPWIEFAPIGIEGGYVGAAWLWDGDRIAAGIHMPPNLTIATPPGWHFNGSLGERFRMERVRATQRRGRQYEKD